MSASCTTLLEETIPGPNLEKDPAIQVTMKSLITVQMKTTAAWPSAEPLLGPHPYTYIPMTKLGCHQKLKGF